MRWFYPYRSFKHSKWWRHKIGHTWNIKYRLIYSCAHFVIEIDEKSSYNGGFWYDLMTISHIVAYFFWATL